MRVKAQVNGEWKEQSVSISVAPPKLKVTASPELVLAGRLVTFKATITPAASYYPLTWNYSPALAAGGGNCSWQPTCTRNVFATGYMVATTTYDGYVLTDSAKVTVTPCATGDSILDNQAIRDSLMAKLQQSNPNDTTNARKEVGGYIARLPDGTYTLVPALQLGVDCSVSLGPPITTGLPSPLTFVGRYHTHPHLDGENVKGCKDKNGNPVTAKAFPSRNGGGSEADWNAADNPSDGFRIPVYIVGKNGEIIRLDPSPRSYSKKDNPKRWRWDSPGCTWGTIV